MTLRLPPPLQIETVLGAIDTTARQTAGAARAAGLPAVRRTLPARTGRLRDGTRATLRRTPIGYLLRIAPTSRVRYPSGVTAAQVFGWVDRGTGIYGPRHRRIHPRYAEAFRLPAGYRSISLEGQRPQDLLDRAFSSADALVERTLAGGAPAAARAIERVVGGLR